MDQYLEGQGAVHLDSLSFSTNDNGCYLSESYAKILLFLMFQTTKKEKGIKQSIYI